MLGCLNWPFSLQAYSAASLLCDNEYFDHPKLISSGADTTATGSPFFISLADRNSVLFHKSLRQCSRFVTFWYRFGCGSWFSDPNLWLTDPALFVSNLQDENENNFYAYSFLKVHLYHFSEVKSHKEVTKTVEIKVFFIFSCENSQVWKYFIGRKRYWPKTRN